MSDEERAVAASVALFCLAAAALMVVRWLFV